MVHIDFVTLLFWPNCVWKRVSTGHRRIRYSIQVFTWTQGFV